MEIAIDEFYREFYAQGHLDFALKSMLQHESVVQWTEWLQTEPIAFFSNSTDWKFNKDKYQVEYEDGDEEEQYQVGMIVTLMNGDKVLHSPEGSQSMFYHITGPTSVTAIYVD